MVEAIIHNVDKSYRLKDDELAIAINTYTHEDQLEEDRYYQVFNQSGKIKDKISNPKNLERIVALKDPLLDFEEEFKYFTSDNYSLRGKVHAKVSLKFPEENAEETEMYYAKLFVDNVVGNREYIEDNDLGYLLTEIKILMKDSLMLKEAENLTSELMITGEIRENVQSTFALQYGLQLDLVVSDLENEYTQRKFKGDSMRRENELNILKNELESKLISSRTGLRAAKGTLKLQRLEYENKKLRYKVERQEIKNAEMRAETAKIEAKTDKMASKIKLEALEENIEEYKKEVLENKKFKSFVKEVLSGLGISGSSATGEVNIVNAKGSEVYLGGSHPSPEQKKRMKAKFSKMEKKFKEMDDEDWDF